MARLVRDNQEKSAAPTSDFFYKFNCINKTFYLLKPSPLNPIVVSLLFKSEYYINVSKISPQTWCQIQTPKALVGSCIVPPQEVLTIELSSSLKRLSDA